ncbi:MAG: FKBP-type peptidyl-prolyl cis-trans isomerase [Bacteroidales bacterium]|nr:FKBP-type peptidyl-prolyl cis-trans isomerase [Bacteroidales bacterium]
MTNTNAHIKISVSYTLTAVQKGIILESYSEEKPIQFFLGDNQLLPDFEQQLMELQPGDSFDFVIAAENAYGPVDPYAVFDIPLDTFELEDGSFDEQMIKIGNVIPMTDPDGNKHHGEIIELLEDSVTMDFNHPLAGQDLHFKGKVISIK